MELLHTVAEVRERVRQWKNTFGTVITRYQVHPEVERILRERRQAG